MRDLSRRRFVYGTGATLAVGALAGCSGNGDDGGDDGGSDDGGENGGGVEDHLSDANGYGGSLADHTGEDEVTVSVGAGDGLSFDPAGITVDAGTTVIWEWTGQGGRHNVLSTGESDFEFESDLAEEEGATFEFTFEEAGEAPYVCDPHRAQGMLGGVRVE